MNVGRFGGLGEVLAEARPDVLEIAWLQTTQLNSLLFTRYRDEGGELRVLAGKPINLLVELVEVLDLAASAKEEVTPEMARLRKHPELDKMLLQRSREDALWGFEQLALVQ